MMAQEPSSLLNYKEAIIPIHETEVVVPDELTQDIKKLRQAFGRMINTTDQTMQNIRRLVTKHGRPAMFHAGGVFIPNKEE